MPTIKELKDAIKKYNKENCPRLSGLKKPELEALVEKLGLKTFKTQRPAKKIIKQAVDVTAELKKKEEAERSKAEMRLKERLAKLKKNTNKN